MSFDVENLYRTWEDRFSSISVKYHKVIVCCSGGIDSTVLLHLFFNFLKRKKIFNLEISHVNFGLRGKESLEDQKFLEGLASSYGLICNTYIVSKEERLSRRGESVQEWARRIRYHEFFKFAENKALLAMAHHRDDVSENAILRLSRGSSAGNLSGMKEFSHPFWRPLLHFSKKDIKEYAIANQLKYREDSSNEKTEYSRNVVRHHVLPELEKLYPGAAERIAETAFEAAELSEYLKSLLDKEFEEDALNELTGLSVDKLKDLPKGVVFLILSTLIKKVIEISSANHDAHDGQKTYQKRSQLSRSLLEEIYLKIHESILNPADKLSKWERFLPGEAVLTIDHGRLKLAKASFHAKKNRAEQFERSIARQDLNFFIEPGGCVNFSGAHWPQRSDNAMKTYHIFNRRDAVSQSSSPNRLISRVKIYLPRAGDSISFHGSPNKKCEIKKLMQNFDIPIKKRRTYIVVNVDDCSNFLYDGHNILDVTNKELKVVQDAYGIVLKE